MKFRYLEIGFVLAALLMPVVSQAAGSEAITNFTQVATLSRSGELDVQQQIDYDYGGATPHDVSYGIPTTYHDDQGQDYRIGFKLISAAADSVPLKLSPVVTIQVARIILPAGPSQTKLRHFTLHYTLAPMVLRGDVADTFRMTSTGLTWPVPIDHASFELRAPMPISNATCFTGTQTANTSSCVVSQSGSTATFTTDAPLQPGGVLSIFCTFARGSFTTYLQAYVAPSSWLGLAVAVAAIFIVFISLAVILALRRSRRPIVGVRPPDYTNANDTPKDQAHRH